MPSSAAAVDDSSDDPPVAHLDHPIGARPRPAPSGSRPRPCCRGRLRSSASASSTICSLCASSSPVGSSASTSGARRANAAAIATRCCSPPDSAPARCARAGREPERGQRASAARSRDSVLPGQAQRRGRRSPAPRARARGCRSGTRSRPPAPGRRPARPRPGGCSELLTDAHLARGRLVERAGEREHRALAAARRPEHRHQLAGLDPQLEAPQRDGLDRPRAEDLEHVVASAAPASSAPRRSLGLAPEAASARGVWPGGRRRRSPPPEAPDHHPVRVDVVDARGRAEIDGRDTRPVVHSA